MGLLVEGVWRDEWYDSPRPVIGSYTVTDQKRATGTSFGICSS